MFKRHLQSLLGEELQFSPAVALLGPRQVGKTTLALALLRLIKSQGRIVFQGQSIDAVASSDLRPLRKRMQVVFQDPYASLNPRFTIGQSIREGLDVHDAARAVAERDAMDLVAVLHRHTGFLDGLFHGSVAKRLALQTPIPLLVLEH